MNLKLKVILSAVLIFLFVFGAMQFFNPDKFLAKMWVKQGTLKVETLPSHTNVFVNDNLTGQTPLSTTLSEGVHTVKLVPESGEKSLVTYKTTIRIFNNTTTYLNRQLEVSDLLSAGEMLTLEKSSSSKGQILVSSEPPSMFVTLDGEDRGISPLFMDNVNAGEHEIGVRGEGFVPRSNKINIVDGYKLLADFKLAIDEDYQKKKAETAKKKKETATNKKKQESIIEVIETGTGWLRVRTEPSLGASEAAKVDVGKQFTYFKTEAGWYEITYEADKKGWVSGEFVKVVLDVKPTSPVVSPAQET